MAISKIRKRDGTIVKFKVSKIAAAIEKTMLAVGKDDEELPKKLALAVADELNKIYDDTASVEEVQDVVEKVLINEGQAVMAKAYILYRQKRTELRKLKQGILGKIDDSKLDVNGLLIAKSRYLLKNKDGKVIESPKEMFARVSKVIAAADQAYGRSEEQVAELEEEFYDILTALEFVPGGRILANAGRSNMLYSSFVIPIRDSMASIFKALYHKALVQRLGGGTGFSFSKIRPRGSKLETTSGYASGPIEFIKLYDHASDLTLSDGNRKAANMGSLSVEHPDIVEFITMKERGEVRNFNISVELSDSFMQAVKSGEKYELKDPSTGQIMEVVDANNIFHLLVTMAWKTGDPGILFIDKINQSNPVPGIARIETTDPCGDQLLLPYEGGNIGAINLAMFVRNKRIKWKHLEYVTKLSVRFLDNVVDVSEFPVKRIKTQVKGLRRIGLGIMGFADMLYRLDIPYDSEKALETADKVMKYISNVAFDASKELAAEKGVFPFWQKSIFKDRYKIRNSSLLAISPAGSRSILVDASPGIEPNFALGYSRKVLGGTEIFHINRVLEEVLKEREVYSEDVVRAIVSEGDLDSVDALPQEVKEIFVTAYDIKPDWHVRMQSVFQKYLDNAISKTVNFHRSATIEDIKNVFMLAYDLGCKGITVYREGSLDDEVIRIGR